MINRPALMGRADMLMKQFLCGIVFLFQGKHSCFIWSSGTILDPLEVFPGMVRMERIGSGQLYRNMVAAQFRELAEYSV